MARINKLINVQAPIKEFDGSYSDGSTVNGVHKPIIFKWLRNDYNIGSTYTDDGGGFTQVTSANLLDFDDIVLNQRVFLVYYSSPDVLKVKSGKVISVIDNENFVTDIPFVSELGNVGFVNLDEQGWYLKTIINVSFPEVETIEIESTFDSLFYISVNIAPFLKRYVNMGKMLNTFPANGVEIEGMATVHTIDIIPMATNYDYAVNGWVFQSIFFSQNSTDFIGINGVKQMQSNFGNNYTDYNAKEESLILFLHKLFIAQSPTFFVGYPFWYCHTFSSIGGFRVKPHYYRYNQNGGLISSFTDVVSDGVVYNAISVNDTLIVSGTKSMSVQLFYHNLADTLQYQKSEIYTIDVVTPCDSLGVYLSWLASDGSRYFWLFERRYTVNIETKNLADFTPYNEDIEIQEETTREISNEGNYSYTVGTYVLKEKHQWIKTILHSVNVKMLMNPDDWQTDGCKWQTVLIEKGASRLNESDDRLVDLSFDFVLPEIFIQSE